MPNSQKNQTNQTVQSETSQHELLNQLGRSMALDSDSFQHKLEDRLNHERIRPLIEADETPNWFSVASTRLAFVSVFLVAIISAVFIYSSSPSTKTTAKLVASLGETNIENANVKLGEEIETRNSGQASLLLADYSLLRLDNNTSAILKGRRQVKLKNGRLYAEVSKTSQREPFEVTANDVNIVVLGTAFEVETSNTKTSIKVTRGRVQVSWNESKVILGAGEAISITNENTTPHKTTFENVSPVWIAKLKQAELQNPIIQAMQRHFPSRTLNL